MQLIFTISFFLVPKEHHAKMKPQFHKLKETTIALQKGASTYFSITRLTSIKTLCKDPAIAAQFVFHLQAYI